MAVQIVIELDDNASAGVDKLSGKLKGIDETPMGGVTASLGNIGTIAGGVALAGVTALAAGFAAFATNAVIDGMAFEAQLDAIAAIAGASAEEMQQLEDAAVDLSMNPNYIVNLEEAGQAMEALAASGASVDQILGGAAEASVLLANATGSDFSGAAATATDVMSLFNIEAEDMMEAVNGIVSVTDASKFSFTDYQYALAAAGSVAATTGMEFDDLNATIAAIAPGFASGSAAGTSLKTMLQRLAAPTDEAASWMEALGISAFNADGSFRDMTDISADLNQALYGVSEAGETLTEQQRAQALESIFGADATTAAAEIAKAGAVVYTDLGTAIAQTGLDQEALTAAMEDGKITQFELIEAQQAMTDAQAAAEVGNDNLRGSWEALLGVVDALGWQFYSHVEPGLRLVTQWATEFISTYGPMAIDMFGQWGEGVRTFADSIISLFSGGGADLGSLFSVDSVVAGFDLFLDTVTPLLLDGLSMMFEGIKTWYETTDWVVLTNTMIDMLVTGFDLWTSLQIRLGEFWVALGSWFVSQDWGGLFSAWYDATSASQSTLWERASAGLNTFYQNASLWFFSQDWWGMIQTNMITPITNSLNEGLALAVTSFTTWGTNVSLWFSSIDWYQFGYDATTAIIEGLVTIGRSFETLASWIADIGVWFSSQDWSQHGEDAMTYIMEGLTNIANTVGDTLSVLWANVSGWFSSQDWAGLGKSLADGIAAGITAAGSSIVSAVTAAVQGAVDAAKAAMGINSPSTVTAQGVGAPMGQGVAVGINAQAPAVNAAMSNLLGGAMNTGAGTSFNNSRTVNVNLNVQTNSYDLGSNALGAMALYGGI